MGSTGSGQFSDYRPGGEEGAGEGQAGLPAQDRCSRSFSVVLEDVEHSDYFSRTLALPRTGTRLTIEMRKRIMALNEAGESVGSLPTSMNYLAECLNSNFRYVGTVTTSTPGTTAVLVADFSVDS
jgi:hypothetical protein